MTVSNKPPIIEYDGNGSQTVFAWDWDMIEDSTINVIIGDEQITDFSVQGNTVVFSTPPEDGAAVTIYRRTKIWMPENYRAFGRFNSEKTELSMDRSYLIAQEIFGTGIEDGQFNAIVGAANIYKALAEGSVTIVSERGTDAVISLWAGDSVVPTPNPPDPSITWGGADIEGGVFSLPGNTSGVAAQIRFKLNYNADLPNEAAAFYQNFNGLAFAGWVNVDPDNGDYWMRVNWNGPTQPNNRWTLSDGSNNRAMNEAFPIVAGANGVDGPYFSVYTFGDTPPITRIAPITIEICKDFNGLPDGNWASRNVTLEAIFNVDTQQQEVLVTEGDDPLVTEDDDELII